MTQQQFSVQPTKKLDYPEPKRRFSVYDPIMKALAKLGVTKTLVVENTKGKDPKGAYNRLNTAMRRRAPAPPEGYAWRKRTLDAKKGTIGVSLVRVTPPKAKPTMAALRKRAQAKKKGK